MGFDLFCATFALLLVGAAATYSSADQTTLLEVHNSYRTGVSPGAANMEKMVWDAGLATQAQAWVDQCLFYHPPTSQYPEYNDIGQNLYLKYSSSGVPSQPAASVPVASWYSEVTDYTYGSNSCASGKVCGHYTQVVWHDTTKVGCGIKFCNTATGSTGSTYPNAWVVACNYSPHGNINGLSPYATGNECSKCEGAGKFCENKLCTDCDPNESGCDCQIECENCATASTSDCTCTCEQGYFGTNCDYFCENTHEYCGANPGWPVSLCGEYSYVDSYCPLMCGHCSAGSPVTC